MKEKLRRHVESLFEDTPKTKRTIELREEVYTNSVDRFNDLVANGMDEEEAYKTVINSIGDIHELIDSIVIEEQPIDNELTKKCAMLKAIASGLYVLCFVAFFGVLYVWGNGLLALVVAGIILIAPITIGAYVNNIMPKRVRTDDSMVGEFKEWQTKKRASKELRSSISGILWLVTLIIYFTVSFSTGAWYITWVLFLVAACGEIILNIVMNMVNEDK